MRFVFFGIAAVLIVFVLVRMFLQKKRERQYYSYEVVDDINENLKGLSTIGSDCYPFILILHTDTLDERQNMIASLKLNGIRNVKACVNASEGVLKFYSRDLIDEEKIINILNNLGVNIYDVKAIALS